MVNEKRLIDANAFIDDIKTEIVELWLNGLKGTPQPRDYLYDIINRIGEQPTVDAVEVVHGRWVWDVETHGDPMYGVDEDFGYRCSRCKVWADEYGVDGDIYEEPPTHILHYCPNCGAKMDGDGNG